MKKEYALGLTIDDLGIGDNIGIELVRSSEEKKPVALDLFYGSKTLRFYPDFEKKVAESHVESTLPESKKIDGETTELYLQVEIICQTLAKKLGKFKYLFATSNNNMKKWALSKGNDIFQWDKSEEVEVDVDGKKVKMLKCTKIFQ